MRRILFHHVLNFLNKLETYSINTVEQITGIKAHTLRIWEKRYQTLIPHRTDTNIRYYDDGQLRKLLNVSTLLEHGHKISKIMAFTDEHINSLILDTLANPPEQDLYSIYIKSLTAAMMEYDEVMFDKVYSSVMVRYGVYDTMTKIVYPFLRQTGILWTTENLIPAQEHFASNIIRRKLLSAIDGIPLPREQRKKFLLFLPPDELHEIGLMFTDFVVRNAGKESVYLGANVPYESLKTTIIQTTPHCLVTFITAGTDIAPHITELSVVANRNPKLQILFCCGSHHKIPLHPESIIILNDPVKIFDYLEI